jgi:benzoate/toluate 1,2-dioxygenase beta subunit
VDIRYNFHTLSHRYKKTDHYFGTVYATLRHGGIAGYLVARKKIVLKDDYIRQVVDIYHL